MSAPKYQGSYVGHHVKTTSSLCKKNLAWQDKQTGETRFGVVFGIGYEEYVWNGKEWVKEK